MVDAPCAQDELEQFFKDVDIEFSIFLRGFVKGRGVLTEGLLPIVVVESRVFAELGDGFDDGGANGGFLFLHFEVLADA